MYIDPFVCGVIAGAVVEFAVIIILAVIYSKKRK